MLSVGLTNAIKRILLTLLTYTLRIYKKRLKLNRVDLNFA